MIKQKLSQILLTVGLIPPIILFTDAVQPYIKDMYHSAYIYTNFNHIVEQQEDKFHIHHSNRPSIKFKYSNSYSPAIIDYKKNEISIHLNQLRRLDPTQSIDDILAHEMGHSYMYEICKNINNEDIIINHPDYGIRITKGLIKEGIGEYYKLNHPFIESFDSLLTSDEFPITIEEWKSMSRRNFGARQFFIYTGGYALVKPIIDEFGTKGIELLVANPPTIKDLENLKKYQINILERLRKTI